MIDEKASTIHTYENFPKMLHIFYLAHCSKTFETLGSYDIQIGDQFNIYTMSSKYRNVHWNLALLLINMARGKLAKQSLCPLNVPRCELIEIVNKCSSLWYRFRQIYILMNVSWILNVKRKKRETSLKMPSYHDLSGRNKFVGKEGKKIISEFYKLGSDFQSIF